MQRCNMNGTTVRTSESATYPSQLAKTGANIGLSPFLPTFQ